MEKINNKRTSVLSIYPTAKGFCFCYFEKQTEIIDWGNIRAEKKNFKEKVSQLIEQFKPDTVVCEGNNSESFKRTFASKEKLDVIYSLVPNKKLKKYPRAMVRGVFETFEASSCEDIQNILCDWFPELIDYKPRKRLCIQGKSDRAYLFDAISFAVAHYYVSK